MFLTNFCSLIMIIVHDFIKEYGDQSVLFILSMFHELLVGCLCATCCLKADLPTLTVLS